MGRPALRPRFVCCDQGLPLVGPGMQQTAKQVPQVVLKSLLLVLTAAMCEGPRVDYLIEAVIKAGPILGKVVGALALADRCPCYSHL